MNSKPLSDRRRLEHMLEAMGYALNGYAQLEERTLPDGDLRYFGLIQLIQTVGEAAYQLSREFRAAHPETPWRLIIGMRHILVHEYHRVDEGLIWRVLDNELPALKVQVEQQLATLPE